VRVVPIPEISVEDLAERLGNGAVVIDVRQPDEFETGHVPGALLVPLHEVPARIDELPRDSEVLLICRSGSRSRMAAEFLLAHGVSAVNVAGGTLAWISSGRAVVPGLEPS
jgi:rhodanese-related sulfurtransferase